MDFIIKIAKYEIDKLAGCSFRRFIVDTKCMLATCDNQNLSEYLIILSYITHSTILDKKLNNVIGR